MKNIEQTIGKLVDKANLTIISYVDNEGFPISKAMLSPREHDGIKVFYFSTNTSSNKVSYLRKNRQASIYFFDKRFYHGVSLIGTMEVLDSPEDKERIWRDGDTMYYPKGVTDPDYCVLRFTAIKCRYYSNFKSEDFMI
jgi:pyridoxamine 5'-phosphate oxidase family protein